MTAQVAAHASNSLGNVLDSEMEKGVHLLQMEELIRRIEATDGSRGYQDDLGTEIRQVLDHLRATLDLLHRRPQLEAPDPSRCDLWLH